MATYITVRSRYYFHEIQMVTSLDARDATPDDKWCFPETTCFFKRMRSCSPSDCSPIGCDADPFEMGTRHSILVQVSILDTRVVESRGQRTYYSASKTSN